MRLTGVLSPMRPGPYHKRTFRAILRNVCSTPKSGRWLSVLGCPLCAKSRHSGRFWILLLAGKGAQVHGASPVKLPRRQFLHFAAGAAALPAMPRVASALDYPARPVRIIVGFPAGSSSDLTARLIGQWLSERLGQQFNIENRPGAGKIGRAHV